jgi:hypothetical protein
MYPMRSMGTLYHFSSVGPINMVSQYNVYLVIFFVTLHQLGMLLFSEQTFEA